MLINTLLCKAGWIEKRTGEQGNQHLPLEFDTKLFHSLVDYATVYHDGRMVFKFRNGTEIERKI